MCVRGIGHVFFNIIALYFTENSLRSNIYIFDLYTSVIDIAMCDFYIVSCFFFVSRFYKN